MNVLMLSLAVPLLATAQVSSGPSAPSMLSSDSPAASTRPADAGTATATIAIHAVQATKDGPAVGGDEVTVELYFKNGQTKTLEDRLDDHGVLVLEDLPSEVPFQPMVKVRHAGVSYEAVGEKMGPEQTSQKIDVKVYETTEEQPDWSVHMWHFIAEPTEEGLAVTEMLAVHNPADRAWLGRADDQAGRSTLAIHLPADAQVLNMDGGFHSCCTRRIGEQLVDTMPLRPGVSQYRLHYVLPVADGAARLSLVAPAPVKQVMVFLPAQVSASPGEGFAEVGSYDIRGRPMRGFAISNLSAGREAQIVVSGLAAAAPDASGQGAGSRPRVLAAVGGAVLVLGCLFLLLRPRRRRNVQATDGATA